MNGNQYQYLKFHAQTALLHSFASNQIQILSRIWGYQFFNTVAVDERWDCSELVMQKAWKATFSLENKKRPFPSWTWAKNGLYNSDICGMYYYETSRPISWRQGRNSLGDYYKLSRFWLFVGKPSICTTFLMLGKTSFLNSKLECQRVIKFMLFSVGCSMPCHLPLD